MSATIPDRKKSPGIKVLVIVALLLVLFGIAVTVIANYPSYHVRPGIKPDIVALLADMARNKAGDTDDADNGIWIITSSVTKEPSTDSVIETKEREIDEHGNIVSETTKQPTSDSPDQLSVTCRVTCEYNKDGYKEKERVESPNATEGVNERNHKRIEFDESGRLIASIEGDAKKTYKYAWGTGELTNMSSDVEGANDASVLFTYSNGLITGLFSAWELRDTTYEYDAAGCLTSSRTESKRHSGEEPKVTDCEYEVDENGNISSKTSQATGYQTSYEYAYVPNPSKGAILYAQIVNARSYDE